MGSRFKTGEPVEDPNNPYGPENRTYIERETNPPREGLFYAGFRNNRGIAIQGGIDWEHGRAQTMNAIHSVTRFLGFNDWNFANLKDTHPVQGFFRYGNFNPFTYFY